MSKQTSKLVIPNYIQKKGAIGQNDAKEKWDKIQYAIQQIYSQNASTLSFQVLYTSGYQIVLHKHGDLLYDGVKKTITDYIKGIREKIMEKMDESFLGELLNQWEKHRTAIGMIRDILMYMDRNYVPQNKKTPVYELGIKIFGQEVFHQNCLERIQRLIMDIIQKDRDGDAVADKFLLKNLCQMMIEISKKDIYIPYFETRFINDSREYFNKESIQFFEKSTVTDYLKKVTQRLKQEKDRASKSFDPDTKPKIVTIIKNTMIENYKNRIIDKEGSGCIVMLQDWRVNDLRLVYDVLSLVPGALKPCVELVRTFCSNEGLNIVKDKDMEEKPIEMIEGCIKLRTKYDELLDISFSEVKQGIITRDPDFILAIKKSFDEIVNTNPRFHEYLSLYIDSKLKKGKTQIPENEFDLLFDQAIGLFRHLKDKDIFEKYYKTHLAKRLLSDRSQSDDAEKSFITKLKTEFGYQFTSKLEGMFTDMKVSKETNESYKNYINSINKKPSIELYVQVLTTGYWPITLNNPCNVPNEISSSSKFFTDFYLNAHSGRRIQWQYNMGTADIKTNGFEKKYELNVSSYQMCILLLFNEQSSLTFGDIATATKIPQQELKKNILALTVKNPTHEKLLLKDGETTLSNDTKFTLNDEFNSKLIKVKIMPVVLKESKQQLEDTQQKLDEERKWAMDATIVRIMKARKTMEHRDLILECTKQLQGRFMPTPENLKKRIESLIEREYLERSKESRSKYNYLA